MLSAVLAYHVLHRSNQFGEDVRAQYLLQSGVRISSNLNSGRHKKHFIAVFLNSWKLERTIAWTNWQLLTTHCCNTVSCEVHVGTEILGGKIIIAYLSNSQRDAGKQMRAWLGALQSGRTGQILESGKDLYCIYTAQQKAQRGDLSTWNCVWLKIWTLCS